MANKNIHNMTPAELANHIVEQVGPSCRTIKDTYKMALYAIDFAKEVGVFPAYESKVQRARNLIARWEEQAE